MDGTHYDIAVVGGGLGGSAIAAAMAGAGSSVVLLEASTEFRDRVRGESLMPWGVAESRQLGVHDCFLEAGAHELPWWTEHQGPEVAARRNLAETTAQQLPALGVYHPAMQQTLLTRAETAGAEVVRGASVTTIRPGEHPSLLAEVDGAPREIEARLIIAANGRKSMARSAGGFAVHRDPGGNVVTGNLFGGMPVPDDSNHLWPNPPIGQVALAFPQGNGQVRLYHTTSDREATRLSGDSAVVELVEGAIGCGMPAEYFTNAKPIGPLASFDCAFESVDHPHRDGLVLIGDAATETDPSWGQGLSITLRDARVLRDELLQTEDWRAAADAYATKHTRYVGVLHDVQNWMSELFLTTGDEAEARRAHALPLWEQDPTRPTDVLFSGPDTDLDESARQRFFGEDV